jgi:hypothetical protein
MNIGFLLYAIKVYQQPFAELAVGLGSQFMNKVAHK